MERGEAGWGRKGSQVWCRLSEISASLAGVLEQALPLIASGWAEVGNVRAFIPLSLGSGAL